MSESNGSDSDKQDTQDTQDTGREPRGSGIEPWLREILRCPACRSELRDAQGPDGGPELACTNPECGAAYRIDDGIPVLLADEARSTNG